MDKDTKEINKGISNLINAFYPNIKWNKNEMHSIGKSQYILYKMIKMIFPNEIIYNNYRSDSIKSTITNRMLELDIYIPNKNIAFEYQGEQHYDHHYLYGPPDNYKMKDDEKKKICIESNITLIIIPYWWDYKIESLLSTISKYAPHINLESCYNESTILSKSSNKS